jgi:hypothetical protein
VAKRKQKLAVRSTADAVSTDEKFLRLFAIFVVKGIEDKQKQALTLSAAGFEAPEIANILQVGKNYVNVAIHRRKARKPRSARKRHSRK